ncbi:leucine-rich repeat receptor tyrosine kinase [Aplysia californica]|uniref:Leucine-rich repeat receptor tyrosine kinase n=1 Tax=Aplysia californica TaxID=6500 RepID=F2Q7T6_APLCA|nr:leucine-rich repeat receptor tyrosine kinase [Aplysia californica]ADB97918.1 leucine-rich repeat receptor tyrosine kinase [Aplysia californica]
MNAIRIYSIYACAVVSSLSRCTTFQLPTQLPSPGKAPVLSLPKDTGTVQDSHDVYMYNETPSSEHQSWQLQLNPLDESRPTSETHVIMVSKDSKVSVAATKFPTPQFPTFLTETIKEGSSRNVKQIRKKTRPCTFNCCVFCLPHPSLKVKTTRRERSAGPRQWAMFVKSSLDTGEPTQASVGHPSIRDLDNRRRRVRGTTIDFNFRPSLPKDLDSPFFRVSEKRKTFQTKGENHSTHFGNEVSAQNTYKDTTDAEVDKSVKSLSQRRYESHIAELKPRVHTHNGRSSQQLTESQAARLANVKDWAALLRMSARFHHRSRRRIPRSKLIMPSQSFNVPSHGPGPSASPEYHQNKAPSPEKTIPTRNDAEDVSAITEESDLDTGESVTGSTVSVVDVTNQMCTADYNRYWHKLKSINCVGQQFSSLKPWEKIFVPDVDTLRLNQANFTRFLSALVSSSTPTRVAHLYIENSNVVDLRDVFRAFDSHVIITLKLRRNQITTVSDDVFARASKIESLDLSDNSIATVGDKAFQASLALKYLYLQSNRLTELRANMFPVKNRLQELHLDNNTISKIGRHVFDSLPDLMTLTLSHNPLANLISHPVSIFRQCAQLRTLLLKGCDINNFNQASFAGLTSLRHLDLSHNRLQSIPHGVFIGLHNLTSLDLAANKFTEIRSDWRFPRSLTILSVYNNSIGSVADKAFDGLNLHNVFLGSNRLTTLPAAVQFYLMTRSNVSLAGNPWHCDCNLVYLIQRLQNSPTGHQHVRCSSPAPSRMIDVAVSEIKCPPSKDCHGPGCAECSWGLQRRVGGTCVCMEGTYKGQGLGAKGCHACPPLSYKPLPGNGACRPCSHGSLSLVSGPAPMCVCAAGYFTNQHGDCQKCPRGTFKNYMGLGSCSPCDNRSMEVPHCAALQPLGFNESIGKEQSSNSWPIAVGTLASLTICVTIAILFARQYRAKRRSMSCRRTNNTLSKTNALYMSTKDTQHSSSSSKTSSDFRCSGRHHLCIKEIGNMIGRGAFGQVYDAYAYLKPMDREPTKVAIKRLKETATEEERKNLKEELEQMLNVGPHPNIIGLFGSAVCEGQLCIVMEYAELGDLLSYLKHQCTFPLQYVRVGSDGLVVEQSAPRVEDNASLMVFAWQIAKGMGHLEMHRFIHRDLAARNCLLTMGPIAKVSDFGLSKDAYELGHYKRVQKDRVPFKWLSPEALLWGQYSSKSDVWAFGILLWELYTFGGTPYPQVTTEQLRDLHENGYRLSKPPACPEQLYRIMRTCWREDPRQRPSFRQLEVTLDLLIQKTKKKEYLDLQPLGYSNPLPLKEEDLDDKKTSFEFVYKNRQSVDQPKRHQTQKTESAGERETEKSEDILICSESIPILTENQEITAESDISFDSTVTSGFKSMSSAQTM